MNDDDLRTAKAAALHDAAEGFRRLGESGTDPELNRILAALLEDRAARVDAGEDDHTGIHAADAEWPAPAIDDAEGSGTRER
jgi:hypothetical protein